MKTFKKKFKAAGIKVQYEKANPSPNKTNELNNRGKTIFVSFLVNPGNKNNIKTLKWTKGGNGG